MFKVVSRKTTSYRDIIRSTFKGVSGALQTNSDIIEVISSLSLNALGDALATMAVEVVDPCLDLILTREADNDEIHELWNESLSSYVFSVSKNLINPR